MKALLEKFHLIFTYNRQRDEENLFALLDRSPMKLPGFDLIYDRRPDFTALLMLQAPKHQTYVGISSEKLVACFSLSWGPRYIQGEQKTVSYISDFRASGDRSIALMWRKFYPEFIRTSLNEGIDQHTTAILADNQIALNNLLHPHRDLGFKYDYLKKLTMVNVFAKKPWRKKSSPFSVRFAKPDEEADLIDFLDSESRKSLFGYCYKNFEWDFRRAHWPNFSTEKFLVVKNKADRLIACCLPWAPTTVKKMRVRNLGLPVRMLLFILKTFGLKLPAEAECLKTMYLTNLQISTETSREQRALILQSFLEFTLEQHRDKFHMLSWADEENLHGESAFQRFFQQTTEVLLYRVRPSEHPATPPIEAKICFEMALV